MSTPTQRAAPPTSHQQPRSRSPRRSRRRAPRGPRPRPPPSGSGQDARPRPARPGRTRGRSARLACPQARSELWCSREGRRRAVNDGDGSAALHGSLAAPRPPAVVPPTACAEPDISRRARCAPALRRGRSWRAPGRCSSRPSRRPTRTATSATRRRLAESFDLPGDAQRKLFSTEQQLAQDRSNSDQTAARARRRSPSGAGRRTSAGATTSSALPDSARSDGGGPNPASTNPPLYYLYEAPPTWPARAATSSTAST